jgi:hypothetical protein
MAPILVLIDHNIWDAITIEIPTFLNATGRIGGGCRIEELPRLLSEPIEAAVVDRSFAVDWRSAKNELVMYRPKKEVDPRGIKRPRALPD